ncbi:DEKNAAC103657 [Brettanomyces naardenensis]|uniref:DEKNAAC103657 n=1 Tax=Brettanomyces naardenensis TaxID=13370 RepID=A0A448YNY2_BRENA|nr:DEKNAAC103657 [Brettanomyces naardenensis]
MDNTVKRSYKKVDIEPFYIGAANATLSGDGCIMATAVLEDTIVIDRNRSVILHTIQGDSTEVTALQLSSDGRFLAIISQSQQLRIFNVETGTVIKTVRLSSACYITAADATSSLFSFGLTDGSVIVWDIEGSFITHNFKGHGGTLCSLAFYGELNSKNWKLASGDITGTVKIWDLVRRRCIFTAKEHTSAVRGLGFSHDGATFVSAGRDSLAIVYNTHHWKELKSIPVEMAVEASGFVRIGQEEYLYVAGEGCIMKVWDLARETLFAETERPIKSTEELMMTQVIPLPENPDKLVAILSDQTVEDLDISGDFGESNHIIPVTRRMAGNHGTIADIRYVGPHLDRMALATNSPSLRIVDFENRPFDMELYSGHRDLVNMLDVTIDGLWLATGSKDNTARLWRYDESGDKFHCYAVFEGHSASVTAVALPRTPIDRYPRFLITASEDLTIKKWVIPKPDEDNQVSVVKTSEYTRRAHDKVIHAIDVSPNNDYLATASHDKTAKIWDLQSGETVGVLRGHKRPVYDIRFCAYDRLVATCSGDQTAKVWSLEDFTCTRTYEGHANAVQRISFMDRNQYIVGAGADGLIKIWQVSSGECVQTLDNHDNRIWAMFVKDDGGEFVTADADGAITIWKDNTAEAKDEADAAEKIKVEKEQELRNCISEGDWVRAFGLALKLDHPMRLYNVVKSCIAANQDNGSILGSIELEESIGKLDDEKVKLLFRRIRDWNTNARLFSIAQKLIRVILTRYEPDRLSQIPGIMGYIDAIIPYSERHYGRYDGLVEESYMLDYVAKKMAS